MLAVLDREGGEDEQRVVCGVQRDRCKERLPADPEPSKREAEREAERLEAAKRLEESSGSESGDESEEESVAASQTD